MYEHRLLSALVYYYVESAHLEMDIMWHQEQGHLEDVAQVHTLKVRCVCSFLGGDRIQISCLFGSGPAMSSSSQVS